MRNKIFLTLVLSMLGLFASTNVYADSITTTKPAIEKTYKERPVSLDFQDVEVRAILHLLADVTDLNMVASKEVRGRITLRLHNVPWDQALDVILISKGLGIQTIGNVATIAPIADIEKLNEKLRVKR